MPLTETDIDSFAQELTELYQEATEYFQQSRQHVIREKGDLPFWRYSSESIWAALNDKLRAQAASLQDRLKKLVLRLIDGTKASPLLSEADQADLRTCMRRMSAALHFRRYYKWDTEVLHDEGTVLGVRPAGQSEEDTGFEEASRAFVESYDRVSEVLELFWPSASEQTTTIPSELAGVRKYRPNTAFIMMWMSDEHPELEDVKNTFKEVFKQFGVTALRSDEIEHQDVITRRILEEIANSEFLIADLTGERPSVYYEVGYSHALGKRPILFRKKGTPLHFDLAVHHVPEYENLTDLRQKLQKRLAVLTNKELKDLK